MSINSYEHKIFTRKEDPTIPEGQYINARVPKKNYIFTQEEILNGEIDDQILQAENSFFIFYEDIKMFLDRFFELRDNKHIK